MKKIITIETSNRTEIVDITDYINYELIDKQGICALFLLHTSAALTTANLNTESNLETLEILRHIIPESIKTTDRQSKNHALSSLIGTSLFLPYESGRLVLGTWERVVLIELNGPAVRQISLTTIDLY